MTWLHIIDPNCPYISLFSAIIIAITTVKHLLQCPESKLSQILQYCPRSPRLVGPLRGQCAAPTGHTCNLLIPHVCTTNGGALVCSPSKTASLIHSSTGPARTAWQRKPAPEPIIHALNVGTGSGQPPSSGTGSPHVAQKRMSARFEADAHTPLTRGIACRAMERRAARSCFW